MDVLEVTLPGEASSVPPARHFVQRTLGAWSLDDLAWTASLLVSELAANAALHARTDFTVSLERRGDAVRLSVADGSVHVPRQRRHGLEATTGRGLRLVEDLAQNWGVDPRPHGGKVVWALLSATATAGTDTDTAADDVDALLAAFPDADDSDSDAADAGAGRSGAATLLAAA